MAAASAPGAQAWTARFRGARSPRPGLGQAGPGSQGRTHRGRGRAGAAVPSPPPPPDTRSADRDGNSSAAAATTTTTVDPHHPGRHRRRVESRAPCRRRL